MKTKVKLDECPFCKDPARLETDFYDLGDGPEAWHYVTCVNIASCGNKTDTYYSPQEVIQRWNRRIK